MPEFLALTLADRGDILRAIATRTGRPAQILEKDFWVCWALRELFSIKTGVRMVFKGGTSLSKVFGVIHRFSEDVDISLDYRDLLGGEVPITPRITKSQEKRVGDLLRRKTNEFVRDIITPEISEAFQAATVGQCEIEVSEDGEKVWLRYPTSSGQGSDYIMDAVLLEFGGRNKTEPVEFHTISPLISGELPSLEFPVPSVRVLAAERTFWEKATLIHVECNRQRITRPGRLSRHWYDLALLGGSPFGDRAMKDRTLLEDVVEIKKRFFNAPYANYGDCLSGGLKLVPKGVLLIALERDYKEMLDAGMFDVHPPSFSQLNVVLEEMEDFINNV